jgi:predicted nucleic acid binding AN1-type Zn finger protein
MTKLEELVQRCKDEVASVVLCCTDDQLDRLIKSTSAIELMAELHRCAAENAIILACSHCGGQLTRCMAHEPWSTATFVCSDCQGTFEIWSLFNPPKKFRRDV